MASISIYLNDRASRSNLDLWKKNFSKSFFRHEIIYRVPKTIKEIQKLVQEDIKKKTEYIFSVGGDGTCNLVAQNLINSKIKLMVIPTGTANDFASELGLSRNLIKIVKVFQHKTTKKIDVLKINDKYMLTNGGLGISSNVARNINSIRKKYPSFKLLMKKVGDLIYPLFLLREIFTEFNLSKYEIKVFGKKEPMIISTPLIMINNQPVLGGKFLVAPETKNDDGKFNVTIYKNTSRVAFLNNVRKVLMNEEVSPKEVLKFETKKIEIKAKGRKKLDFLGDGEILCQSKNFKIEVISKAVEVCSYNDSLMYGNTYALEGIDL